MKNIELNSLNVRELKFDESVNINGGDKFGELCGFILGGLLGGPAGVVGSLICAVVGAKVIDWLEDLINGEL